MKRILSILLATTSLLACTQSQPFAETCLARDFLDLSGTWQTNLGACQLPGTTDENHLGGGQHPKDVTIQLTRLYPYTGTVTYEREVEIPESFAGKHLSLYMERTKPSTFWVDGDSIGHICQLYAPHVYQLPTLTPGKHKLRILIDNRNEVVPESVRGSHAWTDATQTNWNGILGRFGIEASGSMSIQYVRTYPDAGKKSVKLLIGLKSDAQAQTERYEMEILCRDPQGKVVAYEKEKISIQPGESVKEKFLPLEGDLKLWSEFHPDLYRLDVVLLKHYQDVDERTKAKAWRFRSEDKVSTTFGIRDFATDGTQFTINGKRTFLRGTHDACVFPLTGYAPTDVESWRRMFRIAKEHGINHYRFHSYTPTEAAFIAADEVGIYLHAELPLWGTIDSTKVWQNEFLRHEAFTTLDWVGNHPSFISFGLGNELWGDANMMRSWLDEFRAVDDRHLYNFGSNNDLGWQGPKEGEDFYITCRVGGSPDPNCQEPWAKELSEAGFGSHARTSFSFADADEGGILNWMRPGTHRNFSNVTSLCKKPIVSHETCQFQIYPDYKEISKYTGVLYPYNHEIFRDRLKENGLTPQIEDFHVATGLWAMECYKADMEYCLRTPGFGGYQLLDIKDYPGQGSALVGVLDAFMESKGLITAEEFRHFNAPVVPMAIMESYVFASEEPLEIDVVISNYTEEDYAQPLNWSIRGDSGISVGKLEYQPIKQGAVGKAGKITLEQLNYDEPQMLTLTLETGEYRNSYKIWYGPKNLPSFEEMIAKARKNGPLTICTSLDKKAEKVLSEGGTVLLIANHSDIEAKSVGSLFTPDYWNYAMFKTISENNNRPVSPGTLGMLAEPKHEALSFFPNEGHSDWQWWSIALNSRPLILDELPHDYLPIIQTVDNIERNHKLGILMEFKVGQGKVLVSTTDLQKICQYPEGRWFCQSLLDYAISDFSPALTLTTEELRQLIYKPAVEGRNIQGVKNITDYKAPVD